MAMARNTRIGKYSLSIPSKSGSFRAQRRNLLATGLRAGLLLPPRRVNQSLVTFSLWNVFEKHRVYNGIPQGRGIPASIRQSNAADYPLNFQHIDASVPQRGNPWRDSGPSLAQ
jgi:hypothetical protein